MAIAEATGVVFESKNVTTIYRVSSSYLKTKMQTIDK